MEFNTSDNSYKSIKATGLAIPPGVCVESEYGCKICETDEFGLYGYISRGFHPFPTF